MNHSVFTVDGVEYQNIHVLSVKRSFAVLDGDNVGRTLDGAMQRDIIGTYYNYSLEIDPARAVRRNTTPFTRSCPPRRTATRCPSPMGAVYCPSRRTYPTGRTSCLTCSAGYPAGTT